MPDIACNQLFQSNQFLVYTFFISTFPTFNYNQQKCQTTYLRLENDTEKRFCFNIWRFLLRLSYVESGNRVDKWSTRAKLDDDGIKCNIYWSRKFQTEGKILFLQKWLAYGQSLLTGWHLEKRRCVIKRSVIITNERLYIEDCIDKIYYRDIFEFGV